MEKRPLKIVTLDIEAGIPLTCQPWIPFAKNPFAAAGTAAPLWL
jgi:hypothetical protein